MDEDKTARAQPSEPESQSPSRWRGDLWLLLVLMFAGLFLVLLASIQQEYVILALGVVAFVVPASAYALADREDSSAKLAEAVRAQTKLLESINDRLLISDQAKRIAFRQRDREALRDAIIEDLRKEDYDAAAALIEEMGETYGYKEEAEHFRQQLIDVQRRRREELLQKAIARIDQICERYDWATAHHEVARLKRLYPDDPRITQLPQRVQRAREKHKIDLEREFLQAAERDDIERAMELLRELDKYLTPEEAEPYTETARGVVGKKRQNLGVQFKMAVQDRDWINALRVGEQLVREFPNSRFAQEVRGMLDLLRERATAQRAAMSEQA